VGGCCGTTPEHISKLNQLLITEESNLSSQESPIDYMVGKNKVLAVNKDLSETKVWQIELNEDNEAWKQIQAGDSDLLIDSIFDIDSDKMKLAYIHVPGLREPDINKFQQFLQILSSYWPNPIAANLTSPLLAEVFLQTVPGRALVESSCQSIEMKTIVAKNGGIFQTASF
jgi:hypothetical protein